jgi:non-ribosomal peptide synthetase component F
MAIEMAGGVYCPLSPRDPEERLHMLVRETNSRVVLVHWLTFGKFGFNISCLSIDDGFSVYESRTDQSTGMLNEANVSCENLAYTIFTSGSTGAPKAVSSFM